MKVSVTAWAAYMLVAATLLWAGQSAVAASDDEVSGTLAAAEASLAEAERLNSVWAIWDKAVPTGDDAPSLGEILKAARDKQKQGDSDEALRLAKLVDFYAKAGIEQARVNQAAGVPQYK